MTIYTPVSISGYNSNPPADDGSAVASNEITWSKHKTKLGDPIKTLSEGIDTNVATAFGKVLAASSSDLSTNTTLTATHHGKFLRITSSPTLTLTAAATLGDGWNCIVFNEGTGTVTISTGETINGAASITIPTQYDFLIISCDGTDFAATQSIAALDNTFSGATNTFTNDVTISGTLTANASTTTVPGLVEKSTTAENNAGTADKFPDAAGMAAYVATKGIVQRVYNSTASMTTHTTAIPFDDTIPQNTEGEEILTQAITPTSASNTLRISVEVPYGSSASNVRTTVAIFQDSTADALAARANHKNTSNREGFHILTYEMTAGTTSSTTFKVRIGGNSGTTTINGSSGSRFLGGVSIASITIEELAA